MNRIALTLIALAVAAATGSATAQDPNRNGGYNHTRTDYARVVDVSALVANTAHA